MDIDKYINEGYKQFIVDVRTFMRLMQNARDFERLNNIVDRYSFMIDNVKVINLMNLRTLGKQGWKQFEPLDELWNCFCGDENAGDYCNNEKCGNHKEVWK